MILILNLLFLFRIIIIIFRFTGLVKLKSILIRGELGQFHPEILKVYLLFYFYRFINNNQVDFDNIEELKATQEFNLVIESNEVIEYNTTTRPIKYFIK